MGGWKLDGSGKEFIRQPNLETWCSQPRNVFLKRLRRQVLNTTILISDDSSDRDGDDVIVEIRLVDETRLFHFAWVPSFSFFMRVVIFARYSECQPGRCNCVFLPWAVRRCT